MISQVFDSSRTIFKGIALQLDSLSFPADTNTYILLFVGCVFKSCVLNRNICGFSLDIDANPLPIRAVATNDTILNFVPAAAAKFVCLLTKQNSNLAVVLDCARLYNVVGVAVPDTDAVSAVPG